MILLLNNFSKCFHFIIKIFVLIVLLDFGFDYYGNGIGNLEYLTTWCLNISHI
jgi:hypothetical protein